MLGKIGFSLNIGMPAVLGLEAEFYRKLRFRFQPSANHPQSYDGAAGGKACAEKAARRRIASFTFTCA